MKRRVMLVVMVPEMGAAGVFAVGPIYRVHAHVQEVLEFLLPSPNL